MVKAKGKEVSSIDNFIKVDCISVSTAPIKATIEDHLQRLGDLLTSSLKKVPPSPDSLTLGVARGSLLPPPPLPPLAAGTPCRDVLQWPYIVGGGGVTPPLDPPDQSDYRGKKQYFQWGKSCWAIFGTQTFGSQTPLPPFQYFPDSPPPPASPSNARGKMHRAPPMGDGRGASFGASFGGGPSPTVMGMMAREASGRHEGRVCGSSGIDLSLRPGLFFRKEVFPGVFFFATQSGLRSSVAGFG